MRYFLHFNVYVSRNLHLSNTCFFNFYNLFNINCLFNNDFLLYFYLSKVLNLYNFNHFPLNDSLHLYFHRPIHVYQFLDVLGDFFNDLNLLINNFFLLNENRFFYLDYLLNFDLNRHFSYNFSNHLFNYLCWYNFFNNHLFWHLFNDYLRNFF